MDDEWTQRCNALFSETETNLKAVKNSLQPPHGLGSDVDFASPNPKLDNRERETKVSESDSGFYLLLLRRLEAQQQANSSLQQRFDDLALQHAKVIDDVRELRTEVVALKAQGHGHLQCGCLDTVDLYRKELHVELDRFGGTLSRLSADAEHGRELASSRRLNEVIIQFDEFREFSRDQLTSLHDELAALRRRTGAVERDVLSCATSVKTLELCNERLMQSRVSSSCAPPPPPHEHDVSNSSTEGAVGATRGKFVKAAAAVNGEEATRSEEVYRRALSDLPLPCASYHHHDHADDVVEDPVSTMNSRTDAAGGCELRARSPNADGSARYRVHWNHSDSSDDEASSDGSMSPSTALLTGSRRQKRPNQRRMQQRTRFSDDSEDGII